MSEITKENLSTLKNTATDRLIACEQQREQLGRPVPQEIYWGGYVDALCQLEGQLTRSQLDWASDGVTRMFSKQEVEKRLREEITNCDACTLCQKRTQTVPGTGPLWTPLCVVGEAPGASEAETGIPFCGKSGILLLGSSGLIPSEIGYQREHLRIENVVRCRPPGNANPDQEQIHSCSYYLRSSLLNVYPKVIISVGVIPTSWFLGEQIAINEVRGKSFIWEGITVMPTFHPAYILRNPSAEGLMRQDLQKVRELLGT